MAGSKASPEDILREVAQSKVALEFLRYLEENYAQRVEEMVCCSLDQLSMYQGRAREARRIRDLLKSYI